MWRRCCLPTQTQTFRHRGGKPNRDRENKMMQTRSRNATHQPNEIGTDQWNERVRRWCGG